MFPYQSTGYDYDASILASTSGLGSFFSGLKTPATGADAASLFNGSALINSYLGHLQNNPIPQQTNTFSFDDNFAYGTTYPGLIGDTGGTGTTTMYSLKQPATGAEISQSVGFGASTGTSAQLGGAGIYPAGSYPAFIASQVNGQLNQYGYDLSDLSYSWDTSGNVNYNFAGNTGSVNIQDSIYAALEGTGYDASMMNLFFAN